MVYNLFFSDLLKVFVDIIMVMGEWDDIKVIILKSYGNCIFCVGVSFNELIVIDDFDIGK